MKVEILNDHLSLLTRFFDTNMWIENISSLSRFQLSQQKFIIPPLPKGRGGYTVFYTPTPRRGGILFYLCPSKIFFGAFFSVTVDGRNLIFGHKCHIGIPYCGKHFWTHQIPTSCLPTLLIFIHIEHICSFFVAFFSATIDG